MGAAGKGVSPPLPPVGGSILPPVPPEPALPTLVVPAIVGVFLGGQIGSRLTRRIKAQRLALLFALILLYLGLSLLLRAFGIEMPGQS